MEEIADCRMSNVSVSDWWQRETQIAESTFIFTFNQNFCQLCPFSHFNSLSVKGINSLDHFMAVQESLLIGPTVGTSAWRENQIMRVMYSSRFPSICNSTEAGRTLTYQCSKSVWAQFLEDDWVGGPVSLENLRETKKPCDFVSSVYLYPGGTLSPTCPSLNHLFELVS